MSLGTTSNSLGQYLPVMNSRRRTSSHAMPGAQGTERVVGGEEGILPF